MVSFFRLLGIGYLLAVLMLLFEILEITLHEAATPYIWPFTAAALTGFVLYFLFVYFAPEEEGHK